MSKNKDLRILIYGALLIPLSIYAFRAFSRIGTNYKNDKLYSEDLEAKLINKYGQQIFDNMLNRFYADNMTDPLAKETWEKMKNSPKTDWTPQMYGWYVNALNTIKQYYLPL
jgi:hypothetical protein